MDISVRKAKETDFKRMLEIYAYYVKNTATTFEYEVPLSKEFSERIQNIMERYPCLVALKDGEIVGYAYAKELNERKAYSHSCELTIYIDKSSRGLGFGKILYEELEKELKKTGISNLYACVAFTDRKDEYLTNASPLFHERLGFEKVGVFKKCGCKFNRLYNIAWYEKIIGEHKK